MQAIVPFSKPGQARDDVVSKHIRKHEKPKNNA